MKKSKIIIALLLASALVIIGPSGCSHPKKTTPYITTSSETAADILSRAASITSVTLDEVITSGIQVTTIKVWMKGNKIRIEAFQQGQTTVTLIDTAVKTTYTYIPAQNTATKTQFDPSFQTIQQRTQGVISYNPTVVGTEMLDGKLCMLIQYNHPQGMAVKEWDWKQYGFPIRIESVASTGLTLVECKNIDFSDIADSMFELPAGVKIN